MPSTATSVDLVHDTPPKMSIASSARAGAAPRPSVASSPTANAIDGFVVIRGSYQKQAPAAPSPIRLDSHRRSVSEAGKKRRAGGEGGHEDEHRRADPW